PLAVLFTVPLEVVPAPDARPGASGVHRPDHRGRVAGAPDPLGSGALPAHVLLLPQGGISLLLAGARRLRGARCEAGLHGRHALARHQPAERAAPAVRVALARERRGDRLLHPPRFDGRDSRPEASLEDPLMANADYETHEHDAIVIGAGGAGLGAAIEAAAQGVSVGLVCKSLLGKAHTV